MADESHEQIERRVDELAREYAKTHDRKMIADKIVTAWSL